jgi:hypothetical protein
MLPVSGDPGSPAQRVPDKVSADETIYGPAIPGDFDDPDTWGYCKYCAFMVAKDPVEQRLFEHGRMDPGWIKRPCRGGNKESSEAPGPEAVALPEPTPEEVIVDAINEDAADYPPPERDE